MPIADMRRYTDLVRAGDATIAERRELLVRHRAAVRTQLEEITASLAAIDHKIALYTDRLGRRALPA